MRNPVSLPIKLASGPSPIRRLEGVSSDGCDVWLKNDSALSPVYGGNKVRKLEWLLAAALARGTTRLLTAGAAGSHHVLATALLGSHVGLPTAAVLCPQMDTPHSRQTLLRSLSALESVHPCASMAHVPFALARYRQSTDFVVPIGGSNTLGARGYDLAVNELRKQIDDGELPEPDLIVTALGSGGTAAGLLCGLLRLGFRSKLCAVQVLGGHTWVKLNLLRLWHQQALLGHSPWTPLQAHARVWVCPSQVGGGYGIPTQAGTVATARAAECQLALDPTYTSKAFAEVLDIVQRIRSGLAYCPVRPWALPANRPLRILYWHTLSSVLPACTPTNLNLALLEERLLTK